MVRRSRQGIIPRRLILSVSAARFVRRLLRISLAARTPAARTRSRPRPRGTEQPVQLHVQDAGLGTRARSGRRSLLRPLRQDPSERHPARYRRLPEQGAGAHRRRGAEVLLLPGGPLARIAHPVRRQDRAVRVPRPLLLQQGDRRRRRLGHRLHGRGTDVRPHHAAGLPARATASTSDRAPAASSPTTTSRSTRSAWRWPSSIRRRLRRAADVPGASRTPANVEHVGSARSHSAARDTVRAELGPPRRSSAASCATAWREAEPPGR